MRPYFFAGMFLLVCILTIYFVIVPLYKAIRKSSVEKIDSLEAFEKELSGNKTKRTQKKISP